jgi:hypothetical protein
VVLLEKKKLSLVAFLVRESRLERTMSVIETFKVGGYGFEGVYH